SVIVRVSLDMAGVILTAADTDSDGRADQVGPFARGFVAPLGLAFHEGALYVSSRGRVATLRDVDGDGQFDDLEEIITGLPNGRHQNNGLAFGPDGKLYINVGSTCNACIETDERNATIMRFNPDGTGGEVYARGLRNVYDIAFHPEDDTLFGADNGRDDKGLDVPEELNLIVEGGDYGWPDCWGEGRGTNCEGTIAPVAELEPRSSADGIAFYTGDQFPPEYHNNIFIAMWGSHSGLQGRKVVRVELSREGESYTARVSDFALGLDRPLDLVVAPDGALLIADYGTGVIYRVYAEDDARDE
ncbi:MAG: PQQ-dependent sugar dehydrogenase, partial [Dehalococcoidia bacterium]